MREGFDVYIRKVIEGGEVIFPEKFTLEPGEKMGDGTRAKTNVDVLKASQGSFHFSAQYLNDPVDDEAVEFKMKYYQEVDNLPQSGSDLMFVDPAFTEKQSQDETGIVITRTTGENIVYVMEARGIRRNPKDMMDELFKLWETYPHIIKTKVESTIGQKVLITLLRQEMIKRNKYYVIEEFLPWTREKKGARIRQLIPRYESGGFRFKKGLTKLRNQMIEFPRSRRDDILDAFSQGVVDWIAPSLRQEGPDKNKEGTFGWWKKRVAKGPIRIGSKLFSDLNSRQTTKIGIRN